MVKEKLAHNLTTQYPQQQNAEIATIINTGTCKNCKKVLIKTKIRIIIIIKIRIAIEIIPKMAHNLRRR